MGSRPRQNDLWNRFLVQAEQRLWPRDAESKRDVQTHKIRLERQQRGGELGRRLGLNIVRLTVPGQA